MAFVFGMPQIIRFNMIQILQEENLPILTFDIKYNVLVYFVQNDRGNLDLKYRSPKLERMESIPFPLYDLHPTIEILSENQTIIVINEEMLLFNFDTASFYSVWKGVNSMSIGSREDDFIALFNNPLDVKSFNFSNMIEVSSISLPFKTQLDKIRFCCNESLCFISNGESIELYSIPNFQHIRSISLGIIGVEMMTVSHNSKYLAILGYLSNGCYLIDLSKDKFVQNYLVFDKSVRSISSLSFINPNLLALGKRSGSILLVDPENVNCDNLIKEVHTGVIHKIIPRETTRSLLSCGTDGKIVESSYADYEV